MAEVEPEVVETVEPEPEPEPEKKKRKKRDDAPVRAPRVRRVAKPSVVREELPAAPAPTEVDANFCCATRTQPACTRKGISTAPPLCPRDCIKNCAI